VPRRSPIGASTATSNGSPARRGPLRRLLARDRAGPLPHLYPFIVNDPGEGTTRPSAGPGGHPRPPHAAPHAGRDLRPPPRPRGAPRRARPSPIDGPAPPRRPLKREIVSLPRAPPGLRRTRAFSDQGDIQRARRLLCDF
jgi:hypothetical protein